MTVKLKGSTAGSVSLVAPSNTSPSGTDVSLILPTDVGSANQVLKTEVLLERLSLVSPLLLLLQLVKLLKR